MIVLSLALAIGSGVNAQSGDDAWSLPRNLSQSASASDPRAVVDALGRVHVVWQDGSGSFFYSSKDGGVWTSPVTVELPFGTRLYETDLPENRPTPLYTPILRADGDGFIHALWMDNEQALQHSRVPADSFDTFTSWSLRQQLGEAALASDLLADDNGTLHVVYIRPLESDLFPAGIYYRQSNDGGVTWSNPSLIYSSSYFRSLPLEQTNLKLESAGDDQLILAWDNRPQERVFAIGSNDGGDSWGELIEVDRRVESDAAEAVGPNGIQVAYDGDLIHLVWQAGHDGLDCALYHRTSSDGGITWQPKKRILESITDCATSTELVAVPGELLFLLFETVDNIYIAAWNGGVWSKPQTHEGLRSFVDPDTFRSVQFGCRQLMLASGDNGEEPNQLSIVGCDESERGDIWYRHQPLQLFETQIIPVETPIWRPPEAVASAGQIESPLLLADTDGFLHAIWSQPATGESDGGGINYSRWDGSRWSAPRSILASPAGEASIGPDIILDRVGNLFAVWTGNKPGQIYLSRSTIARAGIAAEWSSPVEVPVPRAAAGSPSLALDEQGVIYVAYVLPLNEQRGVYVAQSGDEGLNWLEPVEVFDAVEAGWDMVDSSQIASADDGNLHLIWSKHSAPPEAAALGIHYARSADGGVVWSEPTQLTESPIIWSEILTIGDRIIHVIWLDAGGGIWHVTSSDSGETWGQPQSLPGTSQSLGPVDATVDGAGRPLVVEAGEIVGPEQIQNDISSVLRHWTWSDDRWKIGDDTSFDLGKVVGLQTVATAGAKLAILYNVSGLGPESGLDQFELFFTNRDLELPDVEPTPLPTLTATPTPRATVTPTPLPEATATVFFPTEAGDGDGLPLPIDTSNPIASPLLGVIPAGLVVLIAFFVGVRILRSGRR